MSNTKRNELVMEYLPLVDSVLNYFKGNDTGVHTLEDLYQEGCIGLIKAVEKGDPKHPHFETYLKKAVWNSMMRKIELTEKFDLHEILPNAEYDENGDEVTTGVPPEWIAKVEPDSTSIYENALFEYMRDKVKDKGAKLQKGLEFLFLEAKGYKQQDIANMYNFQRKSVSAYISEVKNFFENDNQLRAYLENEV